MQKTKAHAVVVLVLSFLAGATLLTLLSVIQKLWVGFPLLDVRSYFAPVVFGGIAGALLMQWRTRMNALATELRQTVNERTRELNKAQALALTGSWKLNLDTDELAWSDQIFNIFEIDRDKFGADYEAFIERVHPDDRARVKQVFKESVDRRTTYQVVHRLLLADGRIKWVEERGETEYSPSGQPVIARGTVQDISAQVGATERLKMVNHLLDHVHDAAYLVDQSGRFHFVNQEASRMLGYAREALLEMRVTDVDVLYTSDEQWAAAWNLLQKEGSTVFESVHRDCHGSVIPVEINASFFEFDGVEYVAGLARDISERKRANEELEQHHEKLEHLVEERTAELREANRKLLDTHFAMEQAGIGIHWVDANSGRFLYVNDHAARMLGYSPEEMLQLSVPDIDPNFPPGDFKTNAGALFATGTAHFETQQKRKDGGLVEVSLTGYVMPEAQGYPRRFITFNTDISERKSTEELNRQLLDILRESPDFIATATLEGQIRYINPAGLRLVGLDADTEPATLRLVDLYPARAVRLIEQQALTLDQGSWQGESAIQGRQGREIPVYQAILVHRDSGGGPTYLSIIARDITRQKAYERALIEARRTSETANASKSAFLANMSHEIRTPLNGILGMAHLVRRGGLNEEQSRRMDTLEASSEHLLKIINAILELSKIEAGKFELEQRHLRIDELVDRVAAMIDARVQARRLTLAREIDVFPDDLLGDATRLQQALLNYAMNAVKFTENGGITLRARLLEQDADSALIRFEVQDSGIGIEPNDLSKIFMAFEQADNTSTRKYGGTGLGLAITRKIAQLMDGDAGAESEPGEGSTFWFSVRLARGQRGPLVDLHTPAEAESALRQRFAGSRILLAEDEPINSELAQTLLEDIGLVVETAADGLEALRLAARNDYALILMDMQMPNLDGLEATVQIRRLERHKNTPIVAMTANAFAEDRQRCFDSGMNDFIAKPVNPELLFATLLDWLSKSRAPTT